MSTDNFLIQFFYVRIEQAYEPLILIFFVSGFKNLHASKLESNHPKWLLERMFSKISIYIDCKKMLHLKNLCSCRLAISRHYLLIAQTREQCRWRYLNRTHLSAQTVPCDRLAAYHCKSSFPWLLKHLWSLITYKYTQGWC